MKEKENKTVVECLAGKMASFIEGGQEKPMRRRFLIRELNGKKASHMRVWQMCLPGTGTAGIKVLRQDDLTCLSRKKSMGLDGRE